ncbi:hypothetical protein ACFYXD_35590 [Streptomyces platensis]|uniref:hypothetical protein n=1 Tax=Streptomyces platensis TaxID=58346 RepID=UPI0036C04429
MRLHRLHAAATAVVMWPLETLVRLTDRTIYAWHQRRDRSLHQKLTRQVARDVTAAEDPQAVTEQILAAAYKAFYESTPHPTA